MVTTSRKQVDNLIRKSTAEKVKLDIGCGPGKKDGFIGVDIEPIDGVDVIANLEKGLPMFRDNTVDEIHCYHTLEHLDDVVFVMEEFHRILKNGGRVFIRVPHFSNRQAHDIQHKRFFFLMSFDFLDPSTWAGQHFGYMANIKFKIVKRDIVLWKSRVLFYTYLFAVIARKLPHFYEQMLAYISPACELCFELEAQK